MLMYNLFDTMYIIKTGIYLVFVSIQRKLFQLCCCISCLIVQDRITAKYLLI